MEATSADFVMNILNSPSALVIIGATLPVLLAWLPKRHEYKMRELEIESARTEKVIGLKRAEKLQAYWELMEIIGADSSYFSDKENVQQLRIRIFRAQLVSEMATGAILKECSVVAEMLYKERNKELSYRCYDIFRKARALFVEACREEINGVQFDGKEELERLRTKIKKLAMRSTVSRNCYRA